MINRRFFGLIVVTLPLVCLGGEPTSIKVDLTIQTDYLELARAGNPPTFTVLRTSRVVNPKTGKPYDGSDPFPNCNPVRLRRTFRLDSADVLLGEPILVEFRIELDGPGQWDEWFGGNDRGLGRDGNFHFLMRHQDGAWVPDVFEGYSMSSFGGLGGSYPVTRGKPQSCWLAVQQWCAVDRPGVYDLYAFHWARDVRPVGMRQRVEAALPDELKARVEVVEGGELLDRATRKPPRDLSVALVWNDVSTVSPIARLIPEAVKTKLKDAEKATDYAHLRLTVRQGDDQGRAAMVQRWIRPPERHDFQSMVVDRTSAANNALAMARQDDFLPELKRRLGEKKSSVGTIFLGLAMRDNPRAIDMLFEAESSRAIAAMLFLRPSQVPAAIPSLIDLLTSHDPTTRAETERVLRCWTGQKFGHTWEGYHFQRPTLAEGRSIQISYRSWWEQNKADFRPVLHLTP